MTDKEKESRHELDLDQVRANGGISSHELVFNSFKQLAQAFKGSMTAKEKAIEIKTKYFLELSAAYHDQSETWLNIAAKRCSIIAVNEIIASNFPDGIEYEHGQGERYVSDKYTYWQDVKTEIEKA